MPPPEAGGEGSNGRPSLNHLGVLASVLVRNGRPLGMALPPHTRGAPAAHSCRNGLQECPPANPPACTCRRGQQKGEAHTHTQSDRQKGKQAQKQVQQANGPVAHATSTRVAGSLSPLGRHSGLHKDKNMASKPNVMQGKQAAQDPSPLKGK